jgi:hypothetical protein
MVSPSCTHREPSALFAASAVKTQAKSSGRRLVGCRWHSSGTDPLGVHNERELVEEDFHEVRSIYRPARAHNNRGVSPAGCLHPLPVPSG